MRGRPARAEDRSAEMDYEPEPLISLSRRLAGADLDALALRIDHADHRLERD